MDTDDEFRSSFSIEHTHPSLAGHFPGNPVVPGVLVLDRVLGLAEVWTGQAFAALDWPQVKFMQPLLPGQTADVRLSRHGARLRFEVSHAGALLARGEFGPPA